MLASSNGGNDMSYMLMIVEPRGQRAERGLEGGQRAYAEMLAFAEGLKQRGVLRAVESLANDSQAARVEVREGRKRLVDGPFTEAKELVGGFFLVDCETRDEAIAIAAECPAAAWCTVEVRKVGPCWS
jgi:hypothetical protein